MDLSFSAEPAAWIALIDAALVLAVTVGAPITTEQKGAIDALLTALAGLLIRSQVTPVAAARRRLRTPVASPAPRVTGVALVQAQRPTIVGHGHVQPPSST